MIAPTTDRRRSGTRLRGALTEIRHLPSATLRAHARTWIALASSIAPVASAVAAMTRGQQIEAHRFAVLPLSTHQLAPCHLLGLAPIVGDSGAP